MGMLKLDAVVHWSIPVNNLEESEKFYGEILGLEHVGRLAADVVFQAAITTFFFAGAETPS
jgi:catechol 2,3-dioxygenase-like lactoylglutathione lyase family enzyme